jgi:hypothetical protein
VFLPRERTSEENRERVSSMSTPQQGISRVHLVK